MTINMAKNNQKRRQCIYFCPSLNIILLFTQLFLSEAKKDFMPKGYEDDIAKYKLRSNSIVPDLIPKMPDHKLKVVYSHATVNFGNKVNGFEMMDQPVHVIWPCKNNTYYTLMMLGPDSPIREQPMDKDWQHWLVGNIPDNDVEKGDSIHDYCGSLAGYEVGLHRLIYVVYEQPNNEKIHFDEEHLKEDSKYEKRAGFSLKNFTEKYKLVKPVAANFCVLDLDFRLPGT